MVDSNREPFRRLRSHQSKLASWCNRDWTRIRMGEVQLRLTASFSSRLPRAGGRRLPLFHIANITVASLRASATRDFPLPRRASTAWVQPFSLALESQHFMNRRLDWMSNPRVTACPMREIRPERCEAPDWCSLGVSPR